MSQFVCLHSHPIRFRETTKTDSWVSLRTESVRELRDQRRDKKEEAYKMYCENNKTVAEIAELLGLSRMSIYRHINQRQEVVHAG
mgnify:CR=1 FL=1